MTVPNILSIFRIILVPVFIIIVLSDMPNAYIWGIIIFLIAGITDVLDGRIARKYNCTSLLGKILDPFADKLMVASALVCGAIKDVLPAFLPIIYIVKEAVQGIGGAFLYKKIKDMIPSNIMGKITTFFFYITIASVFLIPNMSEAVRIGMVYICLALLALTVVNYVPLGLKAIKANKEKKV